MSPALRALIVEDSPDDAALLVRELETGGFQVRSLRVETPERFSEALKGEVWDIVLADYSMPAFSGMVALELLRANGSDTPFIFVSGTIGEDVAVGAMRSGANDYIIKGNLKRLVPAVERELREAETRRERIRVEGERRRAEEALRASEERHRVLFEHVADLVLLCDADGTIRFTSDGAGQTLGYRPSELRGSSYLDLVHPDDRTRAREAGVQLLRVPGAYGHLVARLRHRDGSWRTVDAVTRNLLEHPDVAGVVVTARDVTERRRLEAELVQTQKLESIGRLAGGVAHDFNNLLTVILGNAEILLHDASAQEKLLEVREIEAAAQRARSLTRQLLAFSRRQVLEPRALDLNAVITNLEDVLRRLVGTRVELETRLDPELAAVLADEVQLEQILMNLSVNARDAMPEGGHLTIATSHANLDELYSGEETVVVAGEYVQLTVTDTGIGMDAETRSHIFEPFFTTKPVGEGTGLGLATVYGIVKQSGGYIWVYSEPGRGASFKVYLPLAGADADPRPARKSPPDPTGHGELVLLVEGDHALRPHIARALRSFGYTVAEMSAMSDALVWLDDAESPPDLLLTDLVLHEGAGHQVEEKALRLNPDLRVLVMSGYTGSMLERHGFAGRNVEFMEKPFTGEQLAGRVGELLSSGA